MHKIIIKNGQIEMSDFFNDKGEKVEKIAMLSIAAKKLMYVAYEALEKDKKDEFIKNALKGDKDEGVKMLKEIRKKVDNAIADKMAKYDLDKINKDLYLHFEDGELIDYKGSFIEICVVMLLRLQKEVDKNGGGIKEFAFCLKQAEESLQVIENRSIAKEVISKFVKENTSIEITKKGVGVRRGNEFLIASILRAIEEIVSNDDEEFFNHFFKAAADENEIKIKAYVKNGEMTFEITRGSKVKRADIIDLLKDCEEAFEKDILKKIKKKTGEGSEQFKKTTRELIADKGLDIYCYIRDQEEKKWYEERENF